MTSLSFNVEEINGELIINFSEQIANGIYNCKICFLDESYKWFRVKIVNNKISFFDDRVVENVNFDYPFLLSKDEESSFIINELFKNNCVSSSNFSVPIIPDFNDEKIKHFDDEIKVLKTKNLMLENKIKFIESEIALIKSTLGL